MLEEAEGLTKKEKAKLRSKLSPYQTHGLGAVPVGVLGAGTVGSLSSLLDKGKPDIRSAALYGTLMGLGYHLGTTGEGGRRRLGEYYKKQLEKKAFLSGAAQRLKSGWRGLKKGLRSGSKPAATKPAVQQVSAQTRAETRARIQAAADARLAESRRQAAGAIRRSGPSAPPRTKPAARKPYEPPGYMPPDTRARVGLPPTRPGPSPGHVRSYSY